MILFTSQNKVWPPYETNKGLNIRFWVLLRIGLLRVNFFAHKKVVESWFLHTSLFARVPKNSELKKMRGRRKSWRVIVTEASWYVSQKYVTKSNSLITRLVLVLRTATVSVCDGEHVASYWNRHYGIDTIYSGLNILSHFTWIKWTSLDPCALVYY